MLSLFAPAVLGFWLLVRDRVCAAGYAHPGLEVAAGAVHHPNRDFPNFCQGRSISD